VNIKGAEMGDIEEKTKSPFDSESEDETIALSMDELDGILSEAEIVKEAQQKQRDKAENEPKEGGPEGGEETGPGEPELDAIDLGEPDLSEELGEIDLGEIDLGEIDLGDDIGEDFGEDISLPEDEEIEEGVISLELPSEDIDEDLSHADEFDISGEIDELSPKDLEDIELEVGDVDTFVQDLEKEFEQEGDISLEQDETDTSGIAEELEALDSEIEELPEEMIDLESLEAEGEPFDLGIEEESGEAGLEEAPVLGEIDEKLEGFDLEDQEAFREAGIEGIEEELGDLGLPGVPEEAELDETGLPGMEEEEFEIPAEPLAAAEPSVEPIEEETVVLSEEEEEILTEDLDLEAEEEEVVTVTGEELSKLEKEGEQGDKTSIDSALYNDITNILRYMDTLLGDLPEDKIKEFSNSSYFDLYKEVFENLGIE